MKIEQEELGKLLVELGYVSADNIKKALDFASSRHLQITDYLFDFGLLSKDLLGQALSEHYKLPYADLNSGQPAKEQVLILPEELAKQYRIVVFKKDDKQIEITTDTAESATDKTLATELKKIFANKKIVFAFSITEDIDEAFSHYRKALATRFAEIIKEKAGAAPEIIEEILADAFLFRASDIHFEPQEKEVVIRFRVDGILQEAGRIDREYYKNIINRIKILAQMRIDEHFAAQDGAIRYQKSGKSYDLRVSIIPTVNGEKTVMRVLSEYVQAITLSDLGLSEHDQIQIESAYKKPFGMILVTGPTGSGKTTTLYALLKKLNRPEVNITTIEDPVEYKMVGINQIQVNNQTNLTFAKGLRSIVRQDPNIILVGEIRDEETAEIAVNAALTGHLLLSTFHANDAATTIPRLLDMNIEPFLLASTLEAIVAQRLVRKLCESCRVSHVSDSSDIFRLYPDLERFITDKKVTFYEAKGCPSCNNTGFKGRIGIFELIHITPLMIELIMTNPSTQQIRALAETEGTRSLFEDGLDKVKNGITTIAELYRVSAPPAKNQNDK